MLTSELSGGTRTDLAVRYREVRIRTEELASVLSAEDQVAQSMPDASPAKWHRAHVTWFFETFVLKPFHGPYVELDPAYAFLFNSYYEAAGPRHSRADRGMITRPGAAAVGDYRRHVDDAMAELLDGPISDEAAGLVEIGLHHEQQHQELLLMDIKHLLSLNPMRPSYDVSLPCAVSGVVAHPLAWHRFEGGVVPIGHDGSGFSFDNERPRHDALLRPFEMADRLVTCGEWLEFIESGGYRDPAHWLSDGWHTAQQAEWRAPQYWFEADGQWQIFTLAGPRPVDLAEPVSHLSYYEADAFAAWAGARLPTEVEWEHAAAAHEPPESVDETDRLHPRPATGAAGGLRQLFGELWQWTSSPYTPYPGFRTAEGAVGEYNGKFMVNTWVLRGGCVATPPGHIRATYRNFFHPATRWHFSGVRLARDV